MRTRQKGWKREINSYRWNEKMQWIAFVLLRFSERIRRSVCLIRTAVAYRFLRGFRWGVKTDRFFAFYLWAALFVLTSVSGWLSWCCLKGSRPSMTRGRSEQTALAHRMTRRSVGTLRSRFDLDTSELPLQRTSKGFLLFCQIKYSLYRNSIQILLNSCHLL